MSDIPFLTADQMREVDRLMIEEYGIELLQMMENAGRGLADLARERFLGGNPRRRAIVLLAGAGGNGGGGLVAARRLHTWGAQVHVLLTRAADTYREVPARQLATLRSMGVALAFEAEPAPLPSADLIVDALIGYSLSGDPRGVPAKLIRRANEAPAPVLSLDVPSGLDATSGHVAEPAIRANATLTLALPKTGLRAPAAGHHVGELYLADIGVPRELYAEASLGLDVGPIFAGGEILPLTIPH